MISPSWRPHGPAGSETGNARVQAIVDHLLRRGKEQDADPARRPAALAGFGRTRDPGAERQDEVLGVVGRVGRVRVGGDGAADLAGGVGGDGVRPGRVLGEHHGGGGGVSDAVSGGGVGRFVQVPGGELRVQHGGERQLAALADTLQHSFIGVGAGALLRGIPIWILSRGSAERVAGATSGCGSASMLAVAPAVFGGDVGVGRSGWGLRLALAC